MHATMTQLHHKAAAEIRTDISSQSASTTHVCVVACAITIHVATTRYGWPKFVFEGDVNGTGLLGQQLPLMLKLEVERCSVQRCFGFC